MKSIPISLTCLLALAGCQTVPDRLPQAEPAPAAACYFAIVTPSSNATASSLRSPAISAEAALDESVKVLTEWDFSLDSTDTELGLISASRERTLPGYYNLYEDDYAPGMRLFGGFGVGRGGFGIGVGGMGFRGGIGQPPLEVERVSVLINNTHVRLSRDVRRFDQWGDMRESYSASNDDFCQRFQTQFMQAVSATRGAL
ncbi:hypothetical protein [Vreelandella sulfidaeris]|uniref:hypothetical protein n=1 Tax=Vreelandella sulfidaeris TaxID=115553 RepID=UPI0035E97189